MEGATWCRNWFLLPWSSQLGFACLDESESVTESAFSTDTCDDVTSIIQSKYKCVDETDDGATVTAQTRKPRRHSDRSDVQESELPQAAVGRRVRLSSATMGTSSKLKLAAIQPEPEPTESVPSAPIVPAPLKSPDIEASLHVIQCASPQTQVEHFQGGPDCSVNDCVGKRLSIQVAKKPTVIIVVDDERTNLRVASR